MRVKLLLAFAIVGPATLAGALTCIYCGPADSGIPPCDGGNTTTKSCSTDYQHPACVAAYDRKGGKLVYGDCVDTAKSECVAVSSNDTQVGTYQCACKTDLCNGLTDAFIRSSSSSASRSFLLFVFAVLASGRFVRF
ncbi:unnamed protein product [Darwinula stevensoni]|uniref:Uncharacterized protein n=1 Tax=Darwinula stevensoni TaxID=69355 RepID=A0A7R9AAT8_9CRUS|nr:unnamed protein product [Darwinula stevensoni]CAG0898605.1 unnamed protein product [Darwinula stevensoni]